MPKNRQCRNYKDCGNYLADDARANAKYCSDTCRYRFNQRLKTAAKEGGSAHLPAHVKEMRRLALEQADDVVREVLRDEVRDQITLHVRDNILGLAERMSGLAPSVVAAITEDLQSPDEIVRSRAYGLWLKYFMPLLKGDEKQEDGRVVVVMNVPGPESAQEIIDMTEEAQEVTEPVETPPAVPLDPETPIRGLLEEGNPAHIEESFESDWPKCKYCKKRKHPAAMRRHDEHSVICSSCQIKLSYKRGKRDPVAAFDRDPLFN
jgi:hypothetical protein